MQNERKRPAQGFEPAGFAIWSQRANHWLARRAPNARRKHLLFALSDSPVCQRKQVARRCRRRRAASAQGRPRPPGDRPRASREPATRSPLGLARRLGAKGPPPPPPPP
eukprot:3680541-Prymnesium_polylepis.1